MNITGFDLTFQCPDTGVIVAVEYENGRLQMWTDEYVGDDEVEEDTESWIKRAMNWEREKYFDNAHEAYDFLQDAGVPEYDLAFIW